jgi:hypothetical protein
MEYAHTLRAPKIVNGAPVMESVERRDGTKVEDFAKIYIGQPLCFGDPTVLQERGVDPTNCPACEWSTKGDMVLPPQRRFAMHVVRYGTRPGSFELVEPFVVSLEIWRFTDQIFSKLTGLALEWSPMLKHDLMLGPCTNATYQKFEVAISQVAEWLKSPDRQRMVLETYKANAVADLTEFCGRKVQVAWMREDLEKIASAYAVARGVAAHGSQLPAWTPTDLNQLLSAGPAAPAGAAVNPALQAGLEALMVATPAAAAVPEAPLVDLTSMLAAVPATVTPGSEALDLAAMLAAVPGVSVAPVAAPASVPSPPVIEDFADLERLLR